MSGTDFTQTPILKLYKPNLLADSGQWGNHWNINADILDGAVGQSSTASIVNVLALGATGDGVTDDTAAIQAALNTYAGKATVFVPDTGHSYNAGGLTLPAGTDLLIHGKLLATAVGGTLINIANVSNITLRGHGTIDGNAAVMGGQPGPVAAINVSQATNVSISGLTVQNAHNWNLNITQSTHVRLYGLKLLNGDNANEFANGCDDCWITNCTMDGPANDFGFAFYGGVTNSGAIGNVVRNAAAGIYVFADSGQAAPCQNIIISGNVVYNNFGGGIVTDTSAADQHVNVTIASNRVYGNNTGNGATTPEIWVDHTYNTVVSDNLVSSGSGGAAAGSWGIGVGSGADCVAVTGNLVYNIGNSSIAGTGLHINSANYVQASGNIFHDFRSPKYMTTSIGGTAAIGSGFIGNVCEDPVSIVPAPDTVLVNALSGRWTLNNQSFSPLPPIAANDAAAATAGVPVGGVYRNGSVMMVRVA
jgi:polygalacturonase